MTSTIQRVMYSPTSTYPYVDYDRGEMRHGLVVTPVSGFGYSIDAALFIAPDDGGFDLGPLGSSQWFNGSGTVVYLTMHAGMAVAHMSHHDRTEISPTPNFGPGVEPTRRVYRQEPISVSIDGSVAVIPLGAP